MLDASAVRRVAEACIAEARDFWRIDQGWSIELELATIEDAAGVCHKLPAYRRATITLDPAQHNSYAEVWANTAHEVVHIVLAEFDLYKFAAEQTGGQAPPIAWETATERTTTQLEAVFLRERPCPFQEVESGSGT